MWTLLVLLLFVPSEPPTPPIFGHVVRAPLEFESEVACKAFRNALRKNLPDFGQRATTLDAPPGYVLGDCVPPGPFRAPAKAIHEP